MAKDEMKLKTTLILCMFLIVSLGSVKADMNSSITHYLTYNGVATDTGTEGDWTLTATGGARTFNTGISGQARNFTGSQSDTVTDTLNGPSYSVSGWFYSEDECETQYDAFTRWGNHIYQYYCWNTVTKTRAQYGGVNAEYDYSGFYAGNDKLSWHHWVMTVNDTDNCVTAWFDGVKVGKGCQSGSPDVSSALWAIGGEDASVSEGFKGLIDEYFVTDNYVMTEEDILAVFNEGNFCNPRVTDCTAPAPAGPTGPDTGLEITALNGYDASSISGFNATVWGNATYGTTGTLLNITLNDTIEYNVTVWSPNHLNNYTFYDVNTSSDLQAYLWEAELHLTAHIFGTWGSVSIFNVTDGTQFNSTTAGETVQLLDADTYSITAKSPYFQDATKSYTLSALENETNNITFYRTLNVTVSDNFLNPVSNFTITMIPLNYSDTQENTTTSGNVIYYVGSGLYNVTAIAAGYAQYAHSFVIQLNDTSSPNVNYNIPLYTTNSFDISFVDESTLAVIDTTKINLDLISELYAANYSTTNGTLYIDLLTPTTYTFRYYGTGFQPRLSTYTLTNNSYNQITLYLLQGGENVTIFVYDQDTKPVEGATIKIYRYSTNSNSYVLMNTIDTDFEGKSIVNLELNSEFYKFFIYYQGVLKKQTQGAYITGTELTFEININDPIAQDYFTVSEVDGYVSFNQETNNFRFYFNDRATSVSQGCLEIYKVTAAGSSSYSSSCTAGSSALILGNVANVTGQKYTANGYIYVAGKKIFFDSYSYTFEAASVYTDNTGVIIVIFFTLLAGTMALWDISISLVLLGIPTLIGSFPFIKWINLPVEYAVGVEVILLILAVIIRKKPF